ncbi:MAG: hypothetical protein BWY24_00329 [Microgenomates group bacterium ADurb.Bin219]|nr:MAG: hypothetical protein BWY24_00329 [Microgenomates group bacterium ADurb.Bin219]
MNEQILIAFIGLVGAIIGGLITSIPIFIQEQRNHKRWLIEKKIAYLKDQIEEIDLSKKLSLKDLQNVLKGGKFEENGNFVSSVPMEVIEAFQKHLPDGKTMIRDIPEAKRQEIFIDAATALERKKIELQKNIKKLLS